MKRLFLFAAMLLAPSLCWAQQTVVTATVLDPSSRAYTFSTGYAALLCPGNQQPTYNGFTVPRTFTITGFDGTGTFTQTLYDVNVILPTGCGYQWHITWSDGVTTFITGTITSVTGAAVNESTAISAFAVLLPSSAGGVVNVTGTSPIVSSGGSAPAISCPTCNTSSASIGGSIANTQVATGSGANTISGSNNLEYIPASGGTVITTSTVGPTNVPGAGIALLNSGGGTTTYFTKDASGAFSIQNDGQSIPNHGILRWDATSTMLLEGGFNAPQLTFYPGASVSPYGTGSAVMEFFNTGIGTHLFAVHGNTGVGDHGAVTLDPFNSAITIYGDTSGSATIGTALAAGTPNPLNVPLTTGQAGQFWQTNGANPQQTTWATTGVQCGTIAAGGACANTLTQAEHCVSGVATLSGGTSTITGISPAFTSSTSWIILTSDVTTPANANHAVAASGTSATFTGTGTDNIQFIACGG